MRLPVDRRAVKPEAREELINGRKVYASPASAEHADLHSDLDYVLRGVAAPGYVSSSDLLTRTSEDWDFAADAAVRRVGDDPETGDRYLEELAFEVKHTQSISALSERAAQLIERGVRRVFVICVKRDAATRKVVAGPVLEWSPQKAAEQETTPISARTRRAAAWQNWLELDPDSAIEDPCLQRPLTVRALLDATEADNAVVLALEAKDNPAVRTIKQRAYDQGKTAGYDEGKAEGMRQAIFDLCEALDIPCTRERRAAVDGMDQAALEALRSHIKASRRWPAEPAA